MTRRLIVGYPVVFHSPYSPTPGVEEVIAPSVLERALREHANVRCLLNHDTSEQVACLDDGTLRLTVDPLGVRAELDVDDSTPARRELLAALDADKIAGGSFAWTMLRNRWHLDRSPVLVEVVDAIVHEVSIILAPKAPRYATTWAVESGPRMQARWRQLDQQRVRFGRPARPAERAADLTLTLPRPNFGVGSRKRRRPAP
jgi:HK97 family phage prohead protease